MARRVCSLVGGHRRWSLVAMFLAYWPRSIHLSPGVAGSCAFLRCDESDACVRKRPLRYKRAERPACPPSALVSSRLAGAQADQVLCVVDSQRRSRTRPTLTNDPRVMHASHRSGDHTGRRNCPSSPVKWTSGRAPGRPLVAHTRRHGRFSGPCVLMGATVGGCNPRPRRKAGRAPGCGPSSHPGGKPSSRGSST